MLVLECVKMSAKSFHRERFQLNSVYFILLHYMIEYFSRLASKFKGRIQVIRKNCENNAPCLKFIKFFVISKRVFLSASDIKAGLNRNQDQILRKNTRMLNAATTSNSLMLAAFFSVH
jgi:hypothetical protein